MTHDASSNRCSVRLAVSNSSSLEVNYLKMSLEDSFTTAARDYLSENEVPEIEAYCIATEIANRPTLSRIADVDERFYLKPDAQATLSITCLGRLGL